MERLPGASRKRVSYEPIANDEDEAASAGDNDTRQASSLAKFSYVEYATFLFLGVTMLWAWNMFLAAAPYFQRRFDGNKGILASFQATEVSVFTLANLGSMVILTKLQASASYPRRIKYALLTMVATFVLLTISTKAFRAVSPEGYFGFFVVMVLVSSIAVGFMQNGLFAFVSGFGPKEYMQGIMTGQAVAGVLPPIVQIISVLSTDGEDAGQDTSTSAMVYFLTATAVSALALLAFFNLMRRAKHTTSRKVPALASYHEDDDDRTPIIAPESGTAERKSVPLRLLASKLRYMSAAVFLTFAVTMVFPVFTSAITTTSPDPGRFLRKANFIPFAFLIWNIGDLLGRLVTLVPRISLAHRPRILLFCSILRVVFIPLYLLCNLHHPGDVNATGKIGIPATVKSDAFYLIVVQFPFGLTNGYLGSCCMMGAGDFVEDDEKEAAGGFMGTMLVAGLAVGSLCSFAIGV